MVFLLCRFGEYLIKVGVQYVIFVLSFTIDI